MHMQALRYELYNFGNSAYGQMLLGLNLKLALHNTKWMITYMLIIDNFNLSSFIYLDIK